MTPPRTPAEFGAALAARGRGRAAPGKIGFEVELALLSEDDRPAEYPQVRALLERIAADSPGAYDEVYEREHLIALQGHRGESVTLEPGGQVELSDGPAESVSEGAARAAEVLRGWASAADALGLQLIAGGLNPNPLDAVPWMPKARYVAMRGWFAGLGARGRLAHTMMKRTLSLQVSFDYADAQHAEELLRLAFRAAPVATSIFAASPWSFGADEGEFQSFRAEAWKFTDPSRQGLIPTLLDPQSPEAALEAYAAHVLSAPMMFRVVNGDYRPMHGASFQEVLDAGAWPDGSPVTEADLWSHNGSVFTDARLKPGLIELRSTDGFVPDDAHLARSIAEPAAFWAGLVYDAQARAAALELLGAISADALRAVHAAIPREGLRAAWGEERVLDRARDLVSLSREGVARLIDAGREGPLALEALDAVAARLERGVSPSDGLRALEREGGRAALLAALRVPTR